MSYTLVKTITNIGDRLIESYDLTKPLSSFLNKAAYLVVNANARTRVLSLGHILTFVAKLDLTKSIEQLIPPLLSESFVANYETTKIPFLNNAKLYNKRLTVFSPLSSPDHTVHFTSVNTPHIVDDATKKGFLDDLAIVSKNDMQHYLVAVNGVFHKTKLLNGVLYVLDGFRTIRLKNRKDITIVDTKQIGGHTIVPLTPANVTKPEYQGNAILQTPIDLKDKTVFVVIDGYFYHRDQNVLEQFAGNKLRLRTAKLPLIEQFRHNPRTVYTPDRYGSDAPLGSRKYTDNFDTLFVGQQQIATSLLTTSDFQYSRLTGYHSFLVVLNNPAVFTVSQELSATGTPQFYQDLSDTTLSGMMTFGCGLCPSYLIWKDVNKRSAIFIPEQDSDSDLWNQTISPKSIPALNDEKSYSAKDRAWLIDYVSR